MAEETGGVGQWAEYSGWAVVMAVESGVARLWVQESGAA